MPSREARAGGCADHGDAARALVNGHGGDDQRRGFTAAASRCPGGDDARHLGAYDPDALAPALGAALRAGGDVRRLTDDGAPRAVEGPLGSGRFDVVGAPPSRGTARTVTALDRDGRQLLVTQPLPSSGGRRGDVVGTSRCCRRRSTARAESGRSTSAATSRRCRVLDGGPWRLGAGPGSGSARPPRRPSGSRPTEPGSRWSCGEPGRGPDRGRRAAARAGRAPGRRATRSRPSDRIERTLVDVA